MNIVCDIDNDSTLVMSKDGETKIVPKNKFYDGEFVVTTSKHYSQKDFVQVLEPTWTDNRGWVYGEHFVERDGSGGGSCYWNEEDMFEKMTNPKDILIAKRLTLQKEISNLNRLTKQAENELEKLEYSLKLIEFA